MRSFTRNSESRLAPPLLSPLATAVWRTLAYVDVFDYPLTAVEIHRYLEGITASISEVETILADDAVLANYIARTDAYYYLAGREAVMEKRRQREVVAQKLWPLALRYGRMIAAMPFTRMVALTGSLAMNNVDEGADFDYLIVAENGRVWLCRAFSIAIVRLAALCGHHLCPNYILAERAIAFPDKNLYTAHEIAQMIPISGLSMYQNMRQANQWVNSYLPNATNPPHDLTNDGGRWRQLRRVFELPLRSAMGKWLENWEMRRKIRKFQTYTNEHAEADFSADWCKGHFDAHKQETLEAYQTRVRHDG
jgi:hypothetical protein